MTNDHSEDKGQGPGRSSGVTQKDHHELDKRVVGLEKDMEHKASKVDLVNAEKWLYRWLLSTTALGAIALLVAILRKLP